MARDIYGLAGLDAIRSFVDIGANIGSFSIAVAKRWPVATGVAYEPIPATFAYLARNLAANCGGRVAAIQSAVMPDSRGPIPMTFDPFSPQSSTAIPERMRHELATVQVETTTLESALRTFPSVDLLKIDVEGAEYDLICAADPTTLRRARSILLEYHAVPGRDPVEVHDRLRSLGFVLKGSDVSERLVLYSNTGQQED